MVALTGYERAVDVERAYAAGFNAHLIAPVSAQDVKAVLIRLFPS
ncbi:MAG: hypothetical protein ABI434_00495 [Burkholderiaceae bacterium]